LKAPPVSDEFIGIVGIATMKEIDVVHKSFPPHHENAMELKLIFGCAQVTGLE
jgi:hypothetical protein